MIRSCRSLPTQEHQLSDTIDEASTLKKDEFKSSNYYSQVSQFKSFDSGDGGFKSAVNVRTQASFLIDAQFCSNQG